MKPPFAGKGKWRPHRGGQNQLERDYEAHLATLVAKGELAWASKHEGIKLRLADNTFWTPDFLVMENDGALVIHEAKGGLFPEHNRVKTKVAADLYPFPIVIARRRAKKDPLFATEPWMLEEV